MSLKNVIFIGTDDLSYLLAEKNEHNGDTSQSGKRVEERASEKERDGCDWWSFSRDDC